MSNFPGYKFGKISDCDHCYRENVPIMKSSPLNGDYCLKCNQERLAEKKAKRDADKVKKPKVNKRKPTGEKALFQSIWSSRPHRSYISGKDLEPYINGPMGVNMFAHVLSKAKNRYPKYKLYDKGIVLLTPKEHFLYDYGTERQKENYAIENPGTNWSKLYTLRESLRDDYSDF